MHFFSSFSVVAAAAMLIAGCATAPMTSSGMPTYDSTKPQVFLAGANVEQAKGVAMGSAATKGWDIARTSDNSLVLERRLSAAAAESLAPGSSRAPTPPRIQVETNFFPRDQGVDVLVGATLVSTGGEEGEKRQDVTESYRPDLERSLASLRNNWAKSRGQVAAAVPPLPAGGTTPVPVDPDVPLAPITATAATGVSASPTEPTSDRAIAASDASEAIAESAASVESAETPGTGVATGWLGTSTSPAPVVDVTSASPAPPAQIPSTAATPVPAPVASAEGTDAPVTTSVPASQNMLALSPSTSNGIWSYYAEHYARVRGCTLAGEGALMVEKTPEYETHRVYCEGGQTFLVRCNAGMCKGTQ